MTLADGAHVRGSPLALTIAPGTVEPARCVASGPGLHHAVAGGVAEFRVRLRDGCDNPVDSACDPLSGAPLPLRLALTPKQLQTSSDVFVDGGEYAVTYSMPISGKYQLAVLLGQDRRHIQGSPFTVVVSQAPAGAQPEAAASG